MRRLVNFDMKIEGFFSHLILLQKSFVEWWNFVRKTKIKGKKILLSVRRVCIMHPYSKCVHWLILYVWVLTIVRSILYVYQSCFRNTARFWEREKEFFFSFWKNFEFAETGLKLFIISILVPFFPLPNHKLAYPGVVNFALPIR